MLPKVNRLKLSKIKSKKFAKKIADPGITIAYSMIEDDFKAAVTVSKNTAKKATDRNRIRRTVTEALKSLDLKNLELLIIVRENIAKLKTEEVKKRLEAILKKIV